MDVKTEPGGIIAEQPSDQEATNIDSIVTKIKEEPTNELQQQQQQHQQQQESQESQDATNDNNNNNNNGQGGVSGDSAANTTGENDDDEEDAEFDNEDETDSNRNNQNGVKQEEGEKTNLIVNYLPQLMTDEEFENLFKKFGKMKSCKIVRNRITGYSYGFGFADFETHEQALKAIEELNGQEVGTKKIKVAFARPAGQDIKQANLYVKNVPSSWSQDDVRKVFEPYGSIIQVRVLGNDRGVAFVLFDLRKQAQDALDALNGKQVDGCEAPFEIKFAAEKKTEKQQGTRRGGRNNNDRQGRRGGRSDQRGGNNFAGGRNNNNQQQNNRNNRSHSDNRRSTSQGRGGQGSGGNMFMNKNNNNMNGNIGPMRQQPANRMNRYAPFIPVQQPQPMAPQPTPMTPYGYAPQQPMIPYMMAGQSMMQMPMGQQPMQPMGGAPVNPYSMGHHQMGPIGYAPPPMAQPSTTMNNMYNVASNTLNNAAQMQPQLGQPMSVRGGPGATSSSSGSGGGGGGGGGAGGNQADGVTLFVYNIGPDCDESELKGMFAPYGSIVRCNVVRKTPGGETKGFGFVTFRNRDQANAAIAAMNNSMRNGRSLQVSFKK